MSAENLQELFVEELRDIYDAEKQLTKALPKMAKAAESQELRAAFEEHLEITRMQVNRVEEVFKSLGMAARGKPCAGMKGLIEEGSEKIEELDKGSTLDAALIASAQKVEHYEIASYGTLATFAEVLNLQDAKDLLGSDARGREGSRRETDWHRGSDKSGRREREGRGAGGRVEHGFHRVAVRARLEQRQRGRSSSRAKKR